MVGAMSDLVHVLKRVDALPEHQQRTLLALLISADPGTVERELNRLLAAVKKEESS